MDERNAFISKDLLRRELILRRNAIKDKPELSRLAEELLLPMLSGSVMIYISIASEVSTDRAIAALLSRSDIKVYAPHTVGGVITPRRLISIGAPDRMGNLPDECYDFCDVAAYLDFCVTPLVGFNGGGHRIGYGKGCYDRFFHRHDISVKVGLAFDCQRAEFQALPHDVPLDCCVTQSGVIYFKKCV